MADSEIEPRHAATSADIETTDDDIVVKQNRTIRAKIVGEVEIGVIEPPRVFNAEVQAYLQRVLMSAVATQYKLGAIESVRISVTLPDDPEAGGDGD